MQFKESDVMIFYPEGQNEAQQRKFNSLDEVKTAMMNGTVIESRVLLCDSDHNLHVDQGNYVVMPF